MFLNISVAAPDTKDMCREFSYYMMILQEIGIESCRSPHRSLHKAIKAVTLNLMILDNKYTMPYTVPSTAIDGRYRCTPLTFAALSQDLAANHYSSTGIFTPQLQKRGLIWIISKQHFEIYDYPLWLDCLTLQTWAQPPKGLFCFRDFAYYYAAGGKKASLTEAFYDFDSADRRSSEWSAAALQQHQELCVRGSSCWIVFDTKTNHPVAPDDTIFGSLGFCEDHLEGRVFAKIALPEQWHYEVPVSPSLLDIDMNGHVNNLHYIRWALSYMDADFCNGQALKSLDTHFLLSAQYGDELCCRSHYIEEQSCIHSILRTSDGSEVFRARSEWAAETSLSRPLQV